MQFGTGSTVTHTPTSPAGSAFTGVVDGQGKMAVSGGAQPISDGTFTPTSPPVVYRRKDSNGDWWAYIYSVDPNRYHKYWWDKQLMQQIHVETGSWTAVA